VLVLVVEVETVKLSLICAVVTETNTVQWVDRRAANRWRWIWCCTSCKTSTLGHCCVQRTKGSRHCWSIKVCFR